MTELPSKFGGMRKDVTEDTRLVITKAERERREKEVAKYKRKKPTFRADTEYRGDKYIPKS